MEIKKDINSIKLSIIIPVYNEKNTIKEILDRVEKQTYIEKQIIVVNDCSQDGCDKIIKDYKFNSEFLILNHKKIMVKVRVLKPLSNISLVMQL